MRQDIEILIADLLHQMLKRGIEAKVIRKISESGELLSFEIVITGYTQ